MPKAKIAITIEEQLLRELDRAVKQGRFTTRSEAVEQAIRKALKAEQLGQFERECAKIDPEEEKALAEEGMGLDQWPDY